MFVFVCFLLLLFLFIGIVMYVYADHQIQKMEQEEKLKDYLYSSYYIFTRKSYREMLTDKGTNGEYKIYSRLRPYEQYGGRFLFNLYLPKKDGNTTEIDMLFITPKCAFVIESKNYRGEITGNYDDIFWNQKLGATMNFKFYNPIMQNRGHIEALKKFIPENLPIYSIIVFSNKCGLYHLPEVPRNVFVINISALNTLISELLSKNDSVYSYKDIDSIQKELFPYSQVSQTVKMQHIDSINEKLRQYNDIVFDNQSSQESA